MALIVVSTKSAVSLAGAQTLSNKTITSPIINSILTAATDGATLTLVARNTAAGTQTVLTVVGAATVANSYMTAQVGGTWTLASGQTWVLPPVTVLGGSGPVSQTTGDTFRLESNTTAKLLVGFQNVSPYGTWFQSDGSYPILLAPVAGGVGIGLTTISAVLHLKAGTATASTAPLKFTSGTSLTTPEAGAVEWDGTNLFITQTDGTRKTIAYV